MCQCVPGMLVFDFGVQDTSPLTSESTIRHDPQWTPTMMLSGASRACCCHGLPQRVTPYSADTPVPAPS
eukprot:89121-Rhodomonas_salina.1